LELEEIQLLLGIEKDNRCNVLGRNKILAYLLLYLFLYRARTGNNYLYG